MAYINCIFHRDLFNSIFTVNNHMDSHHIKCHKNYIHPCSQTDASGIKGAWRGCSATHATIRKLSIGKIFAVVLCAVEGISSY